MMQKRSLISLMLISFIVVLTASLSMANTVIVESKNSLKGDNGVLNVTADVSSAAVSGIEVVLEVSAPGDGYFTNLTVSFDPGFTLLTDRHIDVTNHADGSPDTIRFAALRLDAGDALGSGQTVIAQINFTVNETCGDVITLDGGTFDAGLAGLITTQFVDAATTSAVAAAVTAGAVTVVNTPPTLASISDASLGWGTLHVATAAGADPDPTDVLAYAKVSGPSDLSVDAATGSIVWQTTGADVGAHAVEISVTDNCGASVSVTYNICVTNVAPAIACPGDQSVMAGNTLSVSAAATDSDSGPFALLYSVTTDHPAGATINQSNGEVTLATDVDAAHTGSFTITVTATDSANVDACSPSNADTCVISVQVFYNSATIETVSNQALGQMAEVSIDMVGNPWAVTEIAGYDFLLNFDAGALQFVGTDAGAFHSGCSWEYYTHRIDGNELHVLALSDQNDGVVDATCYSAGSGSTELASVTFLVSNNPGLAGVSMPIRFLWVDCGDNSMSSKDGQTQMISRYVSDPVGGVLQRIDPLGDGTFPTPFGAQASCDAFGSGRMVDFANGAVQAANGSAGGSRGDINVNGLANEVGDGVMFTNFFLQGLGAFGSHVDASIAASDVNADAIVLSVSDLVYLIRVIVGDAPAIPKVGEVVASYSIDPDNGIMSISDATLGAAHVVVRGNAHPRLLAEGMELGYEYNAELDQTSILVSIPMTEGVKGFTGDFLIPDGDLVEKPAFATFEAASVTPKLVPKTFKLEQNYPNPFNPSTTISLSLPSAGPWSLTVYNVKGQVVKSFDGSVTEAGFVDVVWDASDVATGVYFYRTRFGDNVDTKKAVLLK